MDKQELGRQAESLVLDVFLKRGFKLIARNYTVHGVGELDLVLSNESTLAFVEVKTRKIYDRFGGAVYAIQPRKRFRMIHTAVFFLHEHQTWYPNIRFFAGCVTHNKDGIVEKIKIINI